LSRIAVDNASGVTGIPAITILFLKILTVLLYEAILEGSLEPELKS
jgi:hypothetical protein